MSKSANIVPAVLRCSVSFFTTTVHFVVARFTHFVVGCIARAIGGAKQLLDQVAIVTDTPPPFRR